MNHFYDCAVIIQSEIIGQKLFRKKQSCFKACTLLRKNIKAPNKEDATAKFENYIEDSILNITDTVNLKEWRHELHFQNVTLADRLINDFLTSYTFVNKYGTVFIKNVRCLDSIDIYEFNFKETIENFTMAEIFEE